GGGGEGEQTIRVTGPVYRRSAEAAHPPFPAHPRLVLQRRGVEVRVGRLECPQVEPQAGVAALLGARPPAEDLAEASRPAPPRGPRARPARPPEAPPAFLARMRAASASSSERPIPAWTRALRSRRRVPPARTASTSAPASRARIRATARRTAPRRAPSKTNSSPPRR